MKKLFESFLFPLILVLIPFLPNMYGWIVAPDYHYVYADEYTKNPVLEWNRQIKRLVEHIESYGGESIEETPKYLLEEIGKEIYTSLPAMLSGIGFKPYDRLHVKISNLSETDDLRNIKVHFTGCKGFDSFITSPDKFGSIYEGSEIVQTDSVTIKYPKLPRSLSNLKSTGHVVYYGADTSMCRISVDAELIDGTTARGKKVDNINQYLSEQTMEENRYKSIGEYCFRFLVIISLLMLYSRSREK